MWPPACGFATRRANGFFVVATAVATVTATPGAHAPVMPDHHCLFRRLSTDLGSSRSVAAERVLAIATRGPALLGCATPADVVARCLDRADRAAANGALRAL